MAKKKTGVLLHVPAEQLVWEATIACAQAISASMRFYHDGKLKVSQNDLEDVTKLAHSLGTSLALNHIEWLTESRKCSRDEEICIELAKSQTES